MIAERVSHSAPRHSCTILLPSNWNIITMPSTRTGLSASRSAHVSAALALFSCGHGKFWIAFQEPCETAREGEWSEQCRASDRPVCACILQKLRLVLSRNRVLGCVHFPSVVCWVIFLLQKGNLLSFCLHSDHLLHSCFQRAHVDLEMNC